MRGGPAASGACRVARGSVGRAPGCPAIEPGTTRRKGFRLRCDGAIVPLHTVIPPWPQSPLRRDLPPRRGPRRARRRPSRNCARGAAPRQRASRRFKRRCTLTNLPAFAHRSPRVRSRHRPRLRRRETRARLLPGLWGAFPTSRSGDPTIGSRSRSPTAICSDWSWPSSRWSPFWSRWAWRTGRCAAEAASLFELASHWRWA